MKKKFSAQVMKVQEDTLIQYLAGEEEYIKVVKKPAWSEFKKLLTIIDDKVIRTDTGEIDVYKRQGKVMAGIQPAVVSATELFERTYIDHGQSSSCLWARCV